MAARGPKMKATQLRLVEGTTNVTRHGSEEQQKEQIEASKAAFGELIRPRGWRGQTVFAWERYIEPAYWLDASKEALAIAFCELWADFRSAPRKFTPAKHHQLRAYMSELGLTDERNRSMPEAGGDSGTEFDD